MEEVSVLLGAVETRQLLQEAGKAYHTEINDLLLAGLGLALRDWTGEEVLQIGLEGHGRELQGGGMDLSRTVGWFTSLYPVHLWLGKDAGAAALIKGVKEQLRKVPGKGLGYGVLRYQCGDGRLSGTLPWDILFNYLGQLDNAVSGDGLLGVASESVGDSVSSTHRYSEKIQINCKVQGGRLHIDIRYSGLHYRRESILSLSALYLSGLNTLISHCLIQGQQGTAYTPSDYGLEKEISHEELDRFLKEVSNGVRRRDNISGLYRLSGLQQGMLFHSLYNGNAHAYIEQLCCDLIDVDEMVFAGSWKAILDRHSILRSGFYYDVFNIPVQCVYEQVHLPLLCYDYRSQDMSAVSAYTLSDREQGFDFGSAPLMRISLLRLDTHRYRMIWTSHHILFDGWSMQILLEEFLTTYEILSSGGELSAQEEDRYEDYIRFLEGQDVSLAAAYWKSYLSGLEDGRLLPFVREGASRTKGEGHYVQEELELDATLTTALTSYSRRHHITVNTLMQGVWAYLLHSYTGKSDVVYGVTVSGRPEHLAGIEQRVGLYINSLPLRSQYTGMSDIEKWLQGLQSDQLNSRVYQYSGLNEIQGWAGLSGDLFDSILVFENYPLSEVAASRSWRLQVEAVEVHEQTNYPLSIIILPGKTATKLRFSYNSHLLAREYVKTIAGHFAHVLEQIVSGQVRQLSDITLLTAQEQTQLLREFNGPFVPYPLDRSIVELFREQATYNPGATAVTYEGAILNYRDLDIRSNQLAHYLRKQGVTQETLVPLCIERGLEMIIGILGVLKAGGAYVPLDPAYPQERLDHMLADTGAALVLSSRRSKHMLPANVCLFSLDEEVTTLSLEPEHPVEHTVHPNDLAYVIYTSGSTGVPKGVMIEHRGVVNLVCSQVSPLDLKVGTRMFQFASFSFDGSCYEIFCTLLNGGHLLLAPAEVLMEPAALRKLLSEQQAAVVALPPSYQSVLADGLDGLETVISAGEMLNVQLARKIQSNHIKLINTYGPTENTVSATLSLSPIDANGQVTIGKPLDNVKIYITDSTQRLLPVGVPGELCIGGVQVARGYLKRAALSAEKFLPDPYAEGGRLYRTGDLCRWLPDGTIEYLGRIDDQVKIRGYRIELGEIEHALYESGQVSQCVVLARALAQGHSQLVCYLVPAASYDKEALLSWLRSKLPEYMVPGVIQELSSLPLTPNGKVDRKQLLSLSPVECTDNDYVAPVTTSEILLSGVWSELLEWGPIGLEDNFFESGGDSIKVISLVSRLRKASGKEIKIFDVYQHPTIRQLADFIDHTEIGLSNQQQLLVREELSDLYEEMLPVMMAPENIGDIYPMSDIQSGMVYASLVNPALAVYHDQFIYQLSERVDVHIFKQALSLLTQKHEILRTAFKLDLHNTGMQIVYKSVSIAVDTADITHITEEEAREYVKTYLEEERKRPFDVHNPPLWKFTIFHVQHNQTVLLLQFHHAILDGWSMATFSTELNNLYWDLQKNQAPAALRPLKCTYKDFVVESIVEKKNGKNKEFWKQEMAGYKRLDIFSGDAEQQQLEKTYPAAYLKQIQQRTKEDNLSLNGLFFGAYLYVLSMLTHEEELTVGLVTNNRPAMEDGEKLLGCFLNTIPFRFCVEGNAPLTWKTYFRKVQQKLITLKDKGATSLLDITRITDERFSDKNPFFDTLFSFINFHVYDQLEMGVTAGQQLDTIGDGALNYESTNTYLDHTVNITGDKLSVSYSIRKKLSSGKSLTDLLHYTEAVISCYLDHYEEEINREHIITAQERELLLSFNATVAAYPADKSILNLFVKQVIANPDAPALIYEDQQLSYRELHEESDRVAVYLQQLGMQPGTLVPICTGRQAAMLTGILGILKAGGAYVPLDPAYPQDRLEYMLTDTGASVVLSDSQSRPYLPPIDGLHIIVLEEIAAGESTVPCEMALYNIHPHDLAYVIYTSGSTGKPKGVMIEHHSLFNFLLSMQQHLQIDEYCRWLAVTTFSFDIAYLELFLPLISGGTVILTGRDKAMDAFLLMEQLSIHVPTHMQATPATWQMLTDSGWTNTTGMTILAGGEAIAPELKAQLTRTAAAVWNVYGPTETTIWATIQRLHQQEPVKIGRPLHNTQVYILDKYARSYPVGVAGEICIGGTQLARGYLHRPDLTAEKFIQAPHLTDARLYRTGDLGRWLADGTVEYLGRLDDQLKVRGYRIEPGEIEQVLCQSGYVRQAVVTVRTVTGGHKQLVGYIIPQGSPDREKINAYLRNTLPAYMVPNILVEMDAFPLTANGKIDRKALPSPEAAEQPGKDFEAPVTAAERLLARIWEQLLGVAQVGTLDDFFVLGGDSLLAMRVIAILRHQYQIPLMIKDIFSYPVLTQLAKYLETMDKSTLPLYLETRERPTYIPLSFSQERLWFIDRLEGSQAYHIPIVLRLRGRVNLAALESSLQQIIQRHEVLRTVIHEEEGSAYQHIQSGEDWQLEVIKDPILQEETSLSAYIDALTAKVFDLSTDYMLRGSLLELSPTDHILVLTLHHIASDGWSMQIIVRELVILYGHYGQQQSLPALPLQYADYSLWQRTHAAAVVSESSLSYWQQQLRDITPLDLPTDHVRPATLSVAGASYVHTLDITLQQGLQQLSQSNGATMFMTLLAGFQVLLHRYSGQSDISVGSPIANRPYHELEGLVGFFVNTLVLRSDLSGNPTFRRLLEQVRGRTLEAYEHQSVPFEKVVESVVKERDMSRRPLFQVLFVLQNMGQSSIGGEVLGDVEISWAGYTHRTSKFDLTFMLEERPTGLHLQVEYSTELYEQETIVRMVGHYEQLLRSALADIDKEIGCLPMLLAGEMSTLQHFNSGEVNYPKDKTILDLFREQVLRTPDATALVYEGTTLSYRELDERSNQLGYYLRHQGIREDSLVPICVDRSLEMIIGIMGILKAGGAYVPLESAYPGERLRYMLEDTHAKICIVNPQVREKLTSLESHISFISLKEDWPVIEAAPAVVADRHAGVKDLVYIIYTSGSTGYPKGVMIEHLALTDHVYGMIESASLHTCNSFALFASLSADAGHSILFSSLIMGRTLHILSEELLLHKDRLVQYMQDNTIDCMKIVPSLWLSYAEEGVLPLPRKVIVFGGESFSLSVLEQLSAAGYRGLVFNHYGPTEATIGKCIHRVDLDHQYHTVPIGIPFSNTQIYITDSFLQPVPLGVPGEIYIGGDGIARGYLNREELTAEKFIPDPFSKRSGDRLYRTGDMGRWLRDGSIEYLGRMDDQVKVRGYRIELGEIESTLQQHELVSQAVVIARPDQQGSNRLIAYVVPEGIFDRSRIMSYLRACLPEHMIPAALVSLDYLPLTPIGKINKKALPEPDETVQRSISYEAPRTATEVILADIWQNLLNIKQVGIYDDFFELGGHSLLIMKAVIHIQRALHVNIPIRMLFQFKCIAELAAYIDALSVNNTPASEEEFDVFEL
ncbi:non-ribosomal peptide synthetase [Chitinophaga sp. MD30]|uniref:non-ribosomal peptide synthetase n=1 Tax=Chitinophaga sp. MD30 TaxID=2033437 RepID=UPI000BB019F7|nr:non-ribosomal peptide synthetase [Chitinophaga sp. MD30]ASZ12168.1 hypothetical protein CK934_14960 [Chitinophaga sp. MD30]